MKYYKKDKLVIEYPTEFLGNLIIARRIYPIALTELGNIDNVRIIEKKQIKDKRGYQHRQNLILVDLHCSKEQFMDQLSRYFSKKLNLSPSHLKFKLLHHTFFGDLNAKS